MEPSNKTAHALKIVDDYAAGALFSSATDGRGMSEGHSTLEGQCSENAEIAPSYRDGLITLPDLSRGSDLLSPKKRLEMAVNGLPECFENASARRSNLCSR